MSNENHISTLGMRKVRKWDPDLILEVDGKEVKGNFYEVEEIQPTLNKAETKSLKKAKWVKSHDLTAGKFMTVVEGRRFFTNEDMS